MDLMNLVWLGMSVKNMGWLMEKLFIPYELAAKLKELVKYNRLRYKAKHASSQTPSSEGVFFAVTWGFLLSPPCWLILLPSSTEKLMEKLFIPYELAAKLKALGFDEPCLAWYVSEEYGLAYGEVFKSQLFRNAVLAPTFSQAFRWFRENYGDFLRPDWGNVPHFQIIQIEISEGKTYEEAELACLTKLIEIVEQKLK